MLGLHTVRRFGLLFTLALLNSCASTVQDSTGISSEVTRESFAQNRGTKGVVLLDVNWGRRWNCGGYENAELRSFSFDRMPASDLSDDRPADLILEGPARLTSRPTFINYALLIEPGEYALSGFNIKVAKSMSDVGYWVAKRSELIKDGKVQGGSFRVAAGETVYIGNFFLDCYQRPTLWRYYTDGNVKFQAHLTEYKRKYPFLELDRVTYRLFETHSLGRPYELK